MSESELNLSRPAPRQTRERAFISGLFMGASALVMCFYGSHIVANIFQPDCTLKVRDRDTVEGLDDLLTAAGDSVHQQGRIQDEFGHTLMRDSRPSDERGEFIIVSGDRVTFHDVGQSACSAATEYQRRLGWPTVDMPRMEMPGSDSRVGA